MAPPDDGSSSSFYDILGLHKDSTDVEIRCAYKKLAKKWHPDKWSDRSSLAEEAKAKFQQIQEAYSVLSDQNKRAMYDAGVYDKDDDVDGFSEFLDEMASMMANMRQQLIGIIVNALQNDKVDNLLELQQTFEKMVNENWFSIEETRDLNPATESKEAKSDQSLLSSIDDFFFEKTEIEDDVWDDYDCDNVLVSDMDVQDQRFKRAPDEFIANETSKKKPKICSQSKNISVGSHASSLSTVGSASSTTSVA